MDRRGCGCLVLLYHVAFIGVPIWTWFNHSDWFGFVLFWDVVLVSIPISLMIARETKFPAAFVLDLIILAAIAGIAWSNNLIPQWHGDHQNPINVMTANWIQCASDYTGATVKYYGPPDSVNVPNPCIPMAEPARLGPTPQP